MVLFKTTIMGIAVLVLGILLLAVIGQYITVAVQNVEKHDVDPHVEFLVGDMIDRSYSLPAGISAFGSVSVIQVPTNQSSDIKFLVLDAANYQTWISGEQANAVYSTDGQGKFNYTFTTANSGVYYLVFDNRASIFKKYVSFSLAYSEIVTSQEPDVQVPYLGWTLAIIGALIIAIGLARKPSVHWA